MELTKKIGMHHARALMDNVSFNETNRTVDVVFATETPVLVDSYDGPFYEILSMLPSSIRAERSERGLPILDTHHKYGGVLSGFGKARDVKFTGSEGRATLVFSKRSEVDGVVQDVKDGILTDVSVGYRVFKYIHEGTYESGLPLLRAVDWEPTEISLTLMAKDINSGVRSEGEFTQEAIILNSNSPMKTEEGATTPKTVEAAPAPSAEGQRSEGAQSASLIAENAIKTERTRSLEITTAVKSAKLDIAFGERLIAEGKTIDQARALIIEEFAKGDQGSSVRSAIPAIQVNADAKDKFIEGMTNTLMSRANPSYFPIDPKSEFNGLDLVGMARECVIIEGGSVRGLYPSGVAKVALGLDRGRSGMMSTSDFPIILGNTVNRVMQKSYAQARQTFKVVGSKGTAKDFRSMTTVRMSGLSGFDKVVEGGEYEFGTFGESKEVYAIAKYGKIYAVTLEMIVNDDLSALGRIPMMIGNKASVNQSNLFWGVITSNANMSDGIPLFHASHGNLAASGTAISVTSLSAARAAMRLQKDEVGDFIDVEAEYLIVPPELEQVANQYTSANFVANQASSINPEYNRSLTVIVEPRLSADSATAWYLSASPNMIPTVEYSYLEGEGELVTDQRVGFEVDGLEIKARSTFGAKSMDWKGMYKNPGA